MCLISGNALRAAFKPIIIIWQRVRVCIYVYVHVCIVESLKRQGWQEFIIAFKYFADTAS